MNKIRLLLAVFGLTASIVSAGTVTVRDEGAVLVGNDKDKIVAAGASFPFDTVVITNNEFPAPHAFEVYLLNQVTGPRLAVIGLDTSHHWVRIKTGRALNSANGSLDSAARNGTVAFRQGRWADGLVNVMNGVNNAVTPTAVAVAVDNASQVASSPAPSGLPWWFVFLATFGVGVGIWAWIRHRRLKAEEEEQKFRARRYARKYDVADVTSNATANVGGPVYSRPSGPVQPPPNVVVAPGQTVVVPGSSGPGLLDYMIVDSLIHSHDHASPAPTPAPSYSPPPPPTPDPPSYHSGGSDWGSSSSDSSSSDFGGSSFGGSDFGGGSSGGSDF
jgi:uncharacterized membrane protein YgcG